MNRNKKDLKQIHKLLIILILLRGIIMKTLLEILDRVSEITTKAKDMGFIGVKIYDHRDGGENVLHLVVSVDSSNTEASAQNDFLLQYILTNLLGCEVMIMVESKVKELYKSEVAKNSVDLHDQEGIHKLFKVDLSTIFFEEPRQQNSTSKERIQNLALETMHVIKEAAAKKDEVMEGKIGVILTNLENMDYKQRVTEILMAHPEIVDELYEEARIRQSMVAAR